MDDDKIVPSTDGSQGFERRYLLLGLTIAGDFGVVLAAPAVAAAWLGSRLDRHYGSRPLWLIVSLVVAATVSALVIRRRAKTYGQRFQSLIDQEKRARSAQSDPPPEDNRNQTNT